MFLQIIFSIFFTLTTATSQIEIILVADVKAYTEKFKATTDNAERADEAIKLIFQQLQNAYHELGSDIVLLHVEYFTEKDPYGGGSEHRFSIFFKNMPICRFAHFAHFAQTSEFCAKAQYGQQL